MKDDSHGCGGMACHDTFFATGIVGASVAMLRYSIVSLSQESFAPKEAI